MGVRIFSHLESNPSDSFPPPISPHPDCGGSKLSQAGREGVTKTSAQLFPSPAFDSRRRRGRKRKKKEKEGEGEVESDVKSWSRFFCTPWGWTYVRFFHVRGVVDSRNSGLTLANVPIVPDPVAQQG